MSSIRGHMYKYLQDIIRKHTKMCLTKNMSPCKHRHVKKICTYVDASERKTVSKCKQKLWVAEGFLTSSHTEICMNFLSKKVSHLGQARRNNWWHKKRLEDALLATWSDDDGTSCGIQDFFSTNWDALALNLVRSFPDLSPIQGPRPQLLWSPEDLELGPVVEVSLDRPHRVEEGSLNFCLTNQHQQMHLLYSNISSHSHWFWL